MTTALEDKEVVAVENATAVNTETGTTEATAATGVTADVVTAATTTAEAETATDWRADLAGEDKELLGFLGRYHSKDAGLKAIKKIHDDIRSGKYIVPLGEDPTEQEVSDYRKRMGIPEKADAYLESLPKGLVVGDDDRGPMLKVLEKAHAAGAPPAIANAFIEGYYELVEEQSAAQLEANDQARSATEEALRQEWPNPGEYKRNVNVLSNYFSGLPTEVSEAIMSAVDANGVQIANNPAVLKFFMAQALKDNPIATVVPGAGANQASAIADEIKALEKKMENRREWFKDDAAQARYQELITARDKLNQAA